MFRRCKRCLLLVGVVFISTLAKASLLCAQEENLTIVFAGDIMMHQSQIDAAKITEGTFSFEPVFRYVKPILEEADLAIGNLELTLPGEPPYTGYPNFRAPDTLAGTLKNVGFDVLVTSNNHSNDSGKRGILKTIECLDKRGLIHTGTFTDSDDRLHRYPLLVEHKGFRLVLLNYTYGTNYPSTPEPCIVNLIDTNQIQSDLAAAKNLNPDMIIAFMHWGFEYHLNESPFQQDVAQLLFLGGANLIIGAHPHVIQPVKLLHDFSGPKPRRGLVAYSLGNFVSGQVRKNTDLGLLLEVTLERDPISKAVRLGEHHYLPIWRYRGKDNTGQKVIAALPVGYYTSKKGPIPLSDSDYSRMQEVTMRIRASLDRFNSSERALSLPIWKTNNKQK
ncbi:MAG: CapA family protein [Saprospiraceae bacterium]|nr:CapA family protein [Saprospiraceae bacterium]